jgi:NH3-dependent NAD+ synthetase
MSYEKIDHILQKLEKSHAKNRDDRVMTIEYNPDNVDVKKLNKKDVIRLLDLIKRNRHKLEMPPICKLSKE